MTELVLCNASMVDGAGEPAFEGDVAIDDGRIVEVGRAPGRARQEIDVEVSLQETANAVGLRGQTLRCEYHADRYAVSTDARA